MTTKALISGQAGAAVFVDGKRVLSFHLDGPVGVKRRHEEVQQIFAGCSDLVVVEGIGYDSVYSRLELEWAKQRSLALILLLLDVGSHRETRDMAVPDIEELLETKEVFEFVRGRLFVAPLPDSADLIGAINRAYNHPASRLLEILETVGVYQSEIDRCRAAWDAIPAVSFKDEETKEAVAFELVQVCAFYTVATTESEKRGQLLLRFLPLPAFRLWRTGLTSWINAVSKRSTATNRAEDEDEEWESESISRRKRPERMSLSGDLKLEVVNRQKDAIRKALLEGDLAQARAFGEDLFTHQNRNSRPEHIAKSFCDLAQAAKEQGYHELQLEWARKAADVAPGDGWSLVQVGDAYRTLGRWDEAEVAFQAGAVHGQRLVAQNGYAEVLKGSGRMDDALLAYQSTVKEFPNDVVARTGQAEVLKALGRMDDALLAYQSTVKEFPQNVVARTGQAEVLKALGRMDDALLAYQSTVKEFPQNVVARNGQAEVLKALGRMDDALLAYQSTVKEFPHDVVARTGQAEVLKALGRMDDALLAYQSTVKEFPQNVVARTGQAEVLKALGRMDDALLAYQSTVKEFPHDVVARNGQAEVLKALGRMDDALLAYQSTVKEFPQNVVARTGFASVCTIVGEYSLAASMLEPFLNTTPVNWVGLHILAMVRLRTNRYQEASDILERGLREAPFEHRSFFRSGSAFARLLNKDFKQAASFLEDEPSVTVNILQMHIYGELDQQDKARRAYLSVRSNLNPRVIELTNELAARARLESLRSTHSDDWVFEREFELLLAA